MVLWFLVDWIAFYITELSFRLVKWNVRWGLFVGSTILQRETKDWRKSSLFRSVAATFWQNRYLRDLFHCKTNSLFKRITFYHSLIERGKLASIEWYSNIQEERYSDILGWIIKLTIIDDGLLIILRKPVSWELTY